MGVVILQTIRMSRRTGGKLGGEFHHGPRSNGASKITTNGYSNDPKTSKVEPDPTAGVGDRTKHTKEAVPPSASSVNSVLGRVASNNPEVVKMMAKVKIKIARTTRKLEWSAWLIFIEVIIQALTGTPIFKSSATAYGIIAHGYIVVFTIISIVSFAILDDLASK
jgi:hypothetical protein